MKKFLAMLLAFVMLFSLTMPAMAEEGDTRTIYVKNTAEWSTINVYYWTYTNTEAGPVQWPGISMTHVVDDVYSVEIPAEYDTVIFNNGRSQTSDMAIPTDGRNMFDNATNIWSTYGSTGGITGGTEGNVIANYNPTIKITGMSHIGNNVTYDAVTNTYTVLFPAGVEKVAYTHIISGTNLAFYKDALQLMRRENIKRDGSVDVVDVYQIIAYEHITYNTETGNLEIACEPTVATDGQTVVYEYSNDSGVTWETACTQVYKRNYFITNATIDTNGNITVPTEAAYGDTVTLNVSPAEGYMLDTLTVTDASDNSVPVENNAFTMPASDVTVNATFKEGNQPLPIAEITGVSITVDDTTYTEGNVTIKPDSTVTLTVTGTNLQNGTMDNRVDYAHGSGASLNFSGFTFSEDGTTATMTCPASDFSNSSNYEIVYHNNYTADERTQNSTGIYVTYNDGTTPVYNITVEALNGTVTVDKTTAAEGDTVTLTFTPQEGYVLFERAAFDPNNLTELVELNPGADAYTYTFSMPAHNVRVDVMFAKDGKARNDLYFNNGGNIEWTNVQAAFCTDEDWFIDSVSLTMAEDGIYTLPEGTEIPNMTYQIYFTNETDETTTIVVIPTDDRNMYNVLTGEWETYTPSQPPEDVTSAEITWGSLNFTYDDTIAEGATEENGWTCAEGTNTITVENTGETTFTAQPIYTAETDYSEIEGRFYDSEDAEQGRTIGLALNKEQSHTFWLRLLGKPEKAIPAGTKIGTVTIEIVEGAPE